MHPHGAKFPEKTGRFELIIRTPGNKYSQIPYRDVRNVQAFIPTFALLLLFSFTLELEFFFCIICPSPSSS